MGYDVPDVYHQPERFDLKQVAEMSWSQPSYDFDLTVAWQDENGQLYWASDSGCSCPSPFEDYTSLDDLRLGGIYDLLGELKARYDDRMSYLNESEYYGHQEIEFLQNEYSDMVAKLMML